MVGWQKMLFLGVNMPVDEIYKKYIVSPAWKAKRKQYFGIYGKICQACRTSKDIVLHHKTYDRFRRELMVDLCGLCQQCHREVHKIQRKTNQPLAKVTDSYVYSMRKTQTLRKKK